MEEIPKHCMFECEHVVVLWRKFGFESFSLLSPSEPFQLELHALISAHGILPALVMWVVWKARNLMVFEQKVTPVTTQMMQALFLLQDVSKAYGHESVASAHIPSPIAVSWKKPEEGWVVLNVDGSAITNPGRTGYGGLVRNKDGEFLVGFYGSAGISHISHAEMLALLQGIWLCREMGFSAIQCYSDSANTIRMIKEGVPPTHQEANEVATIKQLLTLDWRVELHHTL